MKTIVLFPTIDLPIPALKGGAIETLITTLIDQNELYGKYRFVVVSGWSLGIAEAQKKYQYTEFINIRSKWSDKLLLFVYKTIKKLTKAKITPLCLNGVNYRAFLELKKLKFDYLVCEGGFYRDFLTMSKYFGKNKMWLHLHSEFVPNKYIEQSFSTYIAISDFIKDRWKKRIAYKSTPIYVLKNCIDKERFLKNKTSIDVRAKFNIPADTYLVVYVGRIIPIKGVEQLINAFLNARIPQKRLMIVGSTNFGGSQISQYEKRIKRLIDQNKGLITSTGFVHNDYLSAYLSSANLIVMPSLCQEAAGLVAIEALAAGRDFLVTVSGGVGEYARDGYCYKISKDEYFNQTIATDINNQMVENTDWTLFEKKLSNLMEDIATGKLSKPMSAVDYLDEFNCEQYYLNFDRIVQQIVDKRNNDTSKQ